jgi:hypothetical protein
MRTARAAERLREAGGDGSAFGIAPGPPVLERGLTAAAGRSGNDRRAHCEHSGSRERQERKRRMTEQREDGCDPYRRSETDQRVGARRKTAPELAVAAERLGDTR